MPFRAAGLQQVSTFSAHQKPHFAGVQPVLLPTTEDLLTVQRLLQS